MNIYICKYSFTQICSRKCHLCKCSQICPSNCGLISLLLIHSVIYHKVNITISNSCFFLYLVYLSFFSLYSIVTTLVKVKNYFHVAKVNRHVSTLALLSSTFTEFYPLGNLLSNSMNIVKMTVKAG